MDFNESESFETDSDAETDYTPEAIHDTTKSLMYGIYTKLIAYENHYNNIQNKYKSLASTWMVATFIGIGYLLSGIEVSIPFNTYIAIMFLCLLSAEGILLLWFLDAGVYFRLIEAIFVETYFLEKKYPFLGEYHHNILKLHQEGTDPLRFQGFYYFSFIVFLLGIAIVCLNSYLFSFDKIYSYFTFLFLVVGFVFLSIFHKKPMLFRKK
jgi:hypothetical protein